MEVHAEIDYRNKDNQPVHSDICPPECKFENVDDSYRKFLHQCLDEWLDNSQGTGTFYIGSKFIQTLRTLPIKGDVE